MHATRYALLALAGLALPQAAQAQRVAADVVIGSGPVTGRIILGAPYYHRPVYRTVVVYPARYHDGWYHHHGYDRVTLYFDAGRGRYYERPYYHGLRQVVVYRHGGRYYYDRAWDRDYRGYRDYDRGYRDHDRGYRDYDRGREAHRERDYRRDRDDRRDRTEYRDRNDYRERTRDRDRDRR